MSLTQVSDAIILRSRLYGESDKIVTFLTSDLGKLTGIAKGAKNSRRRFANCLDPFTRVRVYFRSRANAGLVFMESCDLVEPPNHLSDPVKFAYANYLTELVDQLTIEAQPAADLYSLLAEGLHEIKVGPASSGFLRTFELRLLRDAGYDPRLGQCERCLDPIEAEATVFLDTAHARVLCSRCQSTPSNALEFPGAAALLLERLKDFTLAEGRDHSMRGAVGVEATQLLSHLLAAHLPRSLRSTTAIAALLSGKSGPAS